jgi:chaperone required for assembly of F1-ATPase
MEELEKKVDTNSSVRSNVPMTHQRYAGRKRFYKTVSVKEVEPGAVSSFYSFRL